MCRLFALLAITLLIFTSADAQKKTDREKEDLFGAVRSVRAEVTDYADGDLKEQVRTKQLDTVSYGADGSELERTIYDDYGFLVGKEVHTYDANGKKIESTLLDPDGLVMEKRRYSYDRGELIQIISYDKKGTIGLKQVNSYNPIGRLREETYYNSKKAVGKTVYKYDAGGAVSQVAFFLGDGSRAVATIGPCLGAHKVAYSYDEKGKLINVVAYEPDGKKKKTWAHTFNPKGLLAEDIQEGAWSHSKFAYIYEYDSQGNWIKQITTIDSRSKLTPNAPYKRHRVILRVITYY